MSESSWPDGIERLLIRLSQPEPTSALVELAFDYLVEQPVGRYIDENRLLAHIDRLWRRDVLERVAREHGRTFFDRELERSRQRQDRLGDWLTEDSTDRIGNLLGKPVRLRRAFLEELVQQEAVRHMVRSIIEEALTRFVDSLNPAKKGGLLGSVGRGAAGVASSMKKGIFSKVGAGLESAMSRAAQSFIDGSMDLMLRRTVDIASSPEMAQRLGELRRTGFDQALELTTHQVVRAAHRLPLDDLAELAPELIAHNLAREDLRQSFLDEVGVVLAIEGQKPVRELLEESDSVDDWRAEIVALVTPLLNDFAATDPFRRWLAPT